MDDQNLGAESEADARAIVNDLTRSLGQQRLTLNAGKTKFLTPEDLVRHFQLKANQRIGETSDAWRVTPRTIEGTALKQGQFEKLWKEIEAEGLQDYGHWDKVLKRCYALAVEADSALLEERALQDLIHYPELDERIFGYFARRNRLNELVSLFAGYCREGENLFEATEAAFFDACLLLDPSDSEEEDLATLAFSFARNSMEGQTERPLGRTAAVLVLYWCGIEEKLVNLFDQKDSMRLPKEVARAWLATSSAVSPESFMETRSKLLGHPADDVWRLATFLQELREGNVTRLGQQWGEKTRWPLQGFYYDARAWLSLDLACQSRAPGLVSKLKAEAKKFRRRTTTRAEKRILRRVAGNLGL
jgi:hypothetical protein